MLLIGNYESAYIAWGQMQPSMHKIKTFVYLKTILIIQIENLQNLSNKKCQNG